MLLDNRRRVEHRSAIRGHWCLIWCDRLGESAEALFYGVDYRFNRGAKFDLVAGFEIGCQAVREAERDSEAKGDADLAPVYRSIPGKDRADTEQPGNKRGYRHTFEKLDKGLLGF